MVYYIIACHKEKHTEQQLSEIMKSQVLKDGSRDIGVSFELTSEKVSFCRIVVKLLFVNLDGQNLIQSWITGCTYGANGLILEI